MFPAQLTRVPSRPIFRLLLISALAFAFLGCAKPQQNAPLPEVKLGLAAFTQPKTSAELLAGYMPEDTPRVPAKEFPQLDEAFTQVLMQKTKRNFKGVEAYFECKDAKAPAQAQGGRATALANWAAVGACMKVDYILVPHILEMRERDGSEAGVVTPAKVVMDVFLIDVKNNSLVGRSHYDETQTALADNLLDAGKFISRGGKWVTSQALAREGMEKAVKDLGL